MDLSSFAAEFKALSELIKEPDEQVRGVGAGCRATGKWQLQLHSPAQQDNLLNHCTQFSRQCTHPVQTQFPQLQWLHGPPRLASWTSHGRQLSTRHDSPVRLNLPFSADQPKPAFS